MSQAPWQALSRAALRRTPNPALSCRNSRIGRQAFSRAARLQDEMATATAHNPLDRMAVKRAHAVEIASYRRRMRFAGAGLALSFCGLLVTVYMFPLDPGKTALNEAPGSAAAVFPADHPPGQTHIGQPGVELVETGTSTVPHFPRTLTLPARESTKTAALPSGIGDADAEFSLVGLGIRTVSFLSIQVYVVGVYVATADLSAVQAAFVREAAGSEGASALIAGEKDALRARLLDPAEGEAVWERVLQRAGVRSVVRIVPTRNTDFAHLRDGFERGINARVKTRPDMAEDDAMGRSVADFKAIFGRGKLAKGEVMLLERGREGELRAWIQQGQGRDQSEDGRRGADGTAWEAMGEIADERISRLMWLNYLAGKKVASEPCRQSVVDGIMAIVERPIGTAETQVV